MPLPVASTLVKDDYQNIWNALVNLKSSCLLVQQNTTGGAACSLIYVLDVAQGSLNLTNMLTTYNANSTLMAGIVTYAQAQSPGSAFSLTDFANTRNAAQAILNAIAAQYPVDAQGHLLDRSWSAISGVVWAAATSAQMPTIMSAISNYLATLV